MSTNELAMNPITVVSFYDGIAIGRAALDYSDIPVKSYYASEINESAIQIAQRNYPEIIQIGTCEFVTPEQFELVGPIDLFIGGSPCQGFSRNGNMLNFNHPQSRLFFEFVRLRDALKPRYWMMENVIMKREWRDIITRYLGVEPTEVDSALLSAQKRQRYYWTNIPFEQPRDLNIPLHTIIEPDGVFETHDDLIWRENGEWRVKNATKQGYLVVENGDCVSLDFPNSKTRRGRVAKQKSMTLTTSCNQGYFIDGRVKRFTPTECERLQTLPDGYTVGVSDTQRRHAIGNGWTRDVISHILNGMKNT